MQDDYEQWFIGLDRDHFVAMCREWHKANSVNLPTDLHDYDSWLNYFKHLSPNEVRSLGVTGASVLSTEAYAALALWADIIQTPSRIAKIYQAGLTKSKGAEQKSIVELAKNNDKLGVLYAIRDGIAEKLDRGTGARDTANLAREMGDILDQIEQAERRAGPKKNTKLAELLGDVAAQPAEPSPKRSRKAGVRRNSYAAKMTIEDVEGDGS